MALFDLTRQEITQSTTEIAEEIAGGRLAAHAKHGANSIESIRAADPRWLSILVEEVGELAHEMTYDSRGTLLTLRREAIDVAIVIVALIARIDTDLAE